MEACHIPPFEEYTFLNVAKILTSATLAMALAACTSPNQTGTNDNGNNNTTPTEVKKTLTGKVTRNGMANPKVLFATSHADAPADAMLAFFNIGDANDRYPGATVVKPGQDGTYSVEYKLGSKATTVGRMIVWNDANDDGKYSDNEVTGGSALAHNNQAMLNFLLSKTEFKEYNGDQTVEVKAAYDWAFPEVTKDMTISVPTGNEKTKVMLITAEGSTKKEAADNLTAALDAGTGRQVATLTAGEYAFSIKLGDKPYKAVGIIVWNDENGDSNFTDETMAVSQTTTENSMALLLGIDDPMNLKVLKTNGDASQDASTPQVFEFNN